MSDDERKYTLKEEEISDGEKIIIENQKILNDLNSKLDSLSNNLKNNIEIDKSQNSLIDLYENITSKLKKDLIQIQEEIIKEKDESEQNKNDALVENDLEIIQENINALNKKYEEEIKKNIVLNQINENTKTELEKLRNENKEKEKQLEINSKNDMNRKNEINYSNYGDFFLGDSIEIPNLFGLNNNNINSDYKFEKQENNDFNKDNENISNNKDNIQNILNNSNNILNNSKENVMRLSDSIYNL